MARVEGSHFRHVQVRLDGNEYIDCVFEDCVLVFGAMAPVSLISCTFRQCQWAFTDAAALTLQFMQAIAAQGGYGRQLIESTFSEILRRASSDEPESEGGTAESET